MEKIVCVRLSSSGCIGCSTKKLYCRPEEPPNPDDPIMDVKGMAVNLSRGTNESWKDKLMANSAVGEKHQKEEKDAKSRGQFVRMVVFEDIGKPLISKFRIDSRLREEGKNNDGEGGWHRGGQHDQEIEDKRGKEKIPE
ncbi:hypothetical protein PVK06_014988 [Gossypium arboreum]|uniref:Uncharacterized protein n=1 Tax=Gossypium arboreum TaxID=29729 RepID=A0ABR0PVY3_GOSAR|nr:hypothetical protein PVK06_014988 [Gossypium arboreum]